MEYRQALIDSNVWESNPLPLFAESNIENIIPPSEYASILPGCIAQVVFTAKYNQVGGRGGKKFFSTIVQEIIVLKKHDEVSESTGEAASPKRKLPRAASFSPQKKKKIA